MLGAMRTLALDYLFQELGSGFPRAGLNAWYEELRANDPERLFPFLVEPAGKIEKVYVIHKTTKENLVQLQLQEISPKIAPYLPFVKPSGSQGAQIGPVIKRSYTKKNGAGPSRKILNTTMEYFREIAEAGKPWSPYFEEIMCILECPQIKLLDGSLIDWKSKGYDSLLECVIQEIGQEKGTAFVTVQDMNGRFPGERPEYLEYLMYEKLVGDRYLTRNTQPKSYANCPLCGRTNVTVFPNALKGAGINFCNVDREGAFPGLDLFQAWKGYALCVPCADLLYVYKNHVLKKTGPKKDRRAFVVPVAGESALIIPFTTLNVGARSDLLKHVNRFIQNIPDDVGTDEETLLDILKDEKGLLSLTFLWADIGQNIENIKGVVTDIPPTTLKRLSEFNDRSREWNHPLFPEIPLTSGQFNFRADLSLRALRPLFHRSGGKKSQYLNESKQLFHLKRAIAAAVYHNTQIPERRFWDEVITTARSYWLEAVGKGNVSSLLNEGRSKRGPFLTAAGWIRHLAWWINYFRQLEVLEMDDHFYEPEMEALKPYFGRESGINSPEKAYAFLLGVLFGKLLDVQAARGVNAGANALTWLRRLTLKGKDLPRLYIRTREKLLAYDTEKSQKVREVLIEIGRLGIQLGDPIELSETQTNYYLLLGQSMSKTIFKKDDN